MEERTSLSTHTPSGQFLFIAMFPNIISDSVFSDQESLVFFPSLEIMVASLIASPQSSWKYHPADKIRNQDIHPWTGQHWDIHNSSTDTDHIRLVLRISSQKSPSCFNSDFTVCLKIFALPSSPKSLILYRACLYGIPHDSFKLKERLLSYFL